LPWKPSRNTSAASTGNSVALPHLRNASQADRLHHGEEHKQRRRAGDRKPSRRGTSVSYTMCCGASTITNATSAQAAA